MVRLLLGFHIAELIGQSQNSLVGVKIAVLLVLNALFGKNAGHCFHVLVRAPVHMQDLVLVLRELVLRTSNHSEVRCGAFGEPDRDLEFDEAVVVVGVLHLFQHDAFLHLSDVLFLDHAHQFVEFLQDHVCSEFVVFAHGLG